MAKVTLIEKFDASAEQTWKVIGGFNSLPDWHPAVQHSELQEEGIVRKLTLVDGTRVLEKLEHHSDDSREHSYSIVQSSLPVADYLATLKVSAEEQGCRVVWSSEFDPSGVSESEAAELVEGIYQAGLDNLREILKDAL